MKDGIIVNDAEELDAVCRLRYELFKEWFRLWLVCHQCDNERENRLAEFCGLFVDDRLKRGKDEFCERKIGEN